MSPAWLIDIPGQCLDDGIPFFFKQWGDINNKKAGRLLDGRTWDQLPSLAEWSQTAAKSSPRFS